MDDCSFEKLLQLLERRLSTDAELRMFDHLDRCDICRETIYHIARDRDEALRILVPQGNKKASRRIPEIDTKDTVLARVSRSNRSLSRHTATGTLG